MNDESTSSQNPGEKPEPQMDPPPDPGPGGPADWVDPAEDDVTPSAPATPDQPRSAQVEDEHVPDEIEDPEELNEDEKDVDPGDEPPA